MPLKQGAIEVPVKIVGSSKFGRYPIISSERTYNMFVSDNWLINFAGYSNQLEVLLGNVQGRGLYTSTRGGFMIYVAGSNVYRINLNSGVISAFFIGAIGTSTGEVFIAENLNSQIVIVATPECWVYNYDTLAFAQPTLSSDLVPKYVTFHNTYFLFGNAITTATGSQWFVYQNNPVDDIQLTLVTERTLQTKADFAQAVIPIPGSSSNVLVIGSVVAEIWNNVGGLDVYKKNTSVNIDFGTPSVSTIAWNEQLICWLAINGESSPAIMTMSGGGAQRISTDGIDFLLSTIKHPSDSTAIFYRQDGHLFYQLTFFNPADNLSIMYDFNTDMFFDLTDWNFNYHPMRQLAYFNNRVYFASLNNGNIYQIGSDITAYEYNTSELYEIPRVRVCDTFRYKDRPERFLTKLFTFVIENGVEPNVPVEDDCVGYMLTEEGNIIYTEDGRPILIEGGYCGVYRPRIDVTISKNGGLTFSNAVPYFMHATGQYKNQPRFNNLGASNMMTIQMRFWGFGRVCISNGMLEIST